MSQFFNVICRPEFAYHPGKMAPGSDEPCALQASDLIKANPSYGAAVEIVTNLCVDAVTFKRFMVGDADHWVITSLAADAAGNPSGWKITPRRKGVTTIINLEESEVGSGRQYAIALRSSY